MYVRPVGRQLHRASAGELVAFLIAYLNLLCARHEARDRRKPAWTNPIGIATMRADWVPDHVLGWMLYQKHIVHLQRPMRHDMRRAADEATESVIFGDHSRFFLTGIGEAFAEEFAAGFISRCDRDFAAAWDLLVMGTLLPRYDKDERVFSWGGHVLKHFGQLACNQELVLLAAEEVGWPRWFDDPLLRVRGKSPKRRLHDTIQDLNRHQTPYLVHFKGDGTGTRIGWEFR